MFELIERLREKPESTKKRIAFLISFSLSGLIFVVWLTVIYPDFSFSEKQRQKASVSEAGAFSSFWSNVTGAVSGVKSQVNEITNIVNSVATTSTHYVVTDESQDTMDSTSATTTQEINTDL